MKILDYTISPLTQLLPYADNEIEKKTDAKVSSHRIEIKPSPNLATSSIQAQIQVHAAKGYAFAFNYDFNFNHSYIPS